MKKANKNSQPTLFDKSEKSTLKVEKVLKSFHAAFFPPIVYL